MNTEAMYATMRPWRLFFKVALPGMVSMFAMSVYSIVEGIFIGRTLGEGAFAAVNIAMPLVMITFSLADMIGVGASAPISIALGRNDHEEANNTFTCSVLLIFAASVLMGTVMWLTAEPLCRMMGADAVLLDTSVRYLQTFALCCPLATVFFAMDNYLRISGFVKSSMVINIGCNLMTIVLLAVFLLVYRMDVVGAALATAIAMCTCSAVAIFPFLRGKALLKFVRPRFHGAMLRKIASCGAPTFLNNISGRVTSILINISLMTLGAETLGAEGGTTAVAVYSILMYASDFCWPLLYGISDSLSPAIGYNWGAEDYGRVKAIARCGYLGTALVGAISTSLLFFFPQTVAGLFVGADEAHLLVLSARAVRLFCFAYVFRWLVVMTQSYFGALGKPLQAGMVSVGTAFVFPVLLLGLLWPLGLDGIWLNFVGVNALSAVLSVILLRRLSREIRKKEAQKAS